MEACEQLVERKTPAFTEKNMQQAKLYMELIREEHQELQEGFNNKDIEEVADACGDLIWVILGLANTVGIPMHRVWHEITTSNMSKTTEGKVIKRNDGKILKPDTYFPPNIKKALQLQENRND